MSTTTLCQQQLCTCKTAADTQRAPPASCLKVTWVKIIRTKIANSKYWSEKYTHRLNYNLGITTGRISAIKVGFYSINFIIEIQLLLLEFSSISPQCNSVCMFASYSLVLPISLERLTLTSKQASHEQHPAPLYWGFPEPLRTCVHP